MNPDVIQFQCSSCYTVLTVPGHLAGVSGPCPHCGHTVTSPAATPGLGGAFPAAPPAPHIPASPPMPQGLGGQGSMLGPRNPMMGPLGGAPAQGPVMPHPHISQHLTPPQPVSAPSSFPGLRPAADTPPWQQPGLGQTLLGTSPAPAAPQANAGSFLPPRRPEGQAPVAGGGTPSGPINAWGTGGAAPAMPQAGAPRGGGLPQSLPGGFSGGVPGMSLPGSSVPAQDPRVLWGAQGGQMAPPPGMQPAAAMAPQQPAGRGRKRDRRAPAPIGPGRGSKVLTVGLAALFLVAFLGAGAWLFQDPLRDAAHRYAGGKSGIDDSGMEQIPHTPDQPSLPQVADTAPLAIEPPNESPPPNVGRFDPNEATPPKMETAPRAAIASLPTPPTVPENPGSEQASAPKTPLGGLVEVPSKQVEAAIQSSGNRDVSGALVKTETKIEAPPEAMPAAEALQKFLAATNIEERMRYTLAPDAMRKFMERYYSVHPDGPIQVDTIGFVRLDPNPQLGGGAHAVFGLESRAWQFPVPVMLEQGKDGFRVDWLSFVEFKDRLLERFFKEYSEGRARFHVGITRTHYFDDTVPNANNKDAFRVSSAPPNPFLSTVFVDKESALGQDLKEKVPWGAQVWAIVELEWLRLGSQKWVELAAVPQLNWYSVPTTTTTKASAPARSTTTPTEIQRAVPIGR